MRIEKYSHELPRQQVLSKRMEVLLSGEEKIWKIWLLKSNNPITQTIPFGVSVFNHKPSLIDVAGS